MLSDPIFQRHNSVLPVAKRVIKKNHIDLACMCKHVYSTRSIQRLTHNDEVVSSNGSIKPPTIEFFYIIQYSLCTNLD